MKVQRDFGNSSPVIRYSPDESRCKIGRGLPLLPGLETKVCAINSKLPIGPSTPLSLTDYNRKIVISTGATRVFQRNSFGGEIFELKIRGR